MIERGYGHMRCGNDRQTLFFPSARHNIGCSYNGSVVLSCTSGGTLD
jgi:hypothetical protein